MERKAKLCTQVMDCAECTSIKAILIKAQLPWAAHVVWMDNHHMPCQLLCGGTCGRQEKARLSVQAVKGQ